MYFFCWALGIGPKINIQIILFLAPGPGLQVQPTEPRLRYPNGSVGWDGTRQNLTESGKSETRDGMSGGIRQTRYAWIYSDGIRQHASTVYVVIMSAAEKPYVGRINRMSAVSSVKLFVLGQCG